jgi:protein-S-isoprenylcysteine O-methyltransferase Ste14
MKIWKPKRNLPLRTRRIAVIVLFFFAQPVPELLLAGAVAMAAGSVIAIFSYSTLLKRDQLATRGPYAFCRHPAYFGMLVSGLGYCLAAGYHLPTIVLSAAFFIISVPLYYRKIRFEEERLEELHGEKFREYTQRVRRKLVPSLISGIRNGGFALKLSFEASIRNHSFKRVSKDCFWFVAFVAKWYYIEGFHPFGRIRWTGRCHNYLLTCALAGLLALFLIFKYLDHRYRKAREAFDSS